MGLALDRRDFEPAVLKVDLAPIHPRNLGIVAHMNRAIELAGGEMIIGGAGDDVSLPERTEAVYEEWMRLGGGVCSIFSNAVIIDKEGRELRTMVGAGPPNYATTLEEAVSRCSVGVAGCSHAFSKKPFEVFGPLEAHLMGEDFVIPFRNLLMGGTISYLNKPLVRYRTHGANVSLGPPGRPSSAKLYREKAHHEAVFLILLRDATTVYGLGCMDKERFDRISSEIFAKLHWGSLEKRCYGMGMRQSAGLLWREFFSITRMRYFIKILERRFRCIDMHGEP